MRSKSIIFISILIAMPKFGIIFLELLFSGLFLFSIRVGGNTMTSKKQIIRGIITSLCILFCYTIGITFFFTFPQKYLLYALFSIICVAICVFVMFANNHAINGWIWIGILIGLPIGYYFYDILYTIFPSLYEYLHPYLFYGHTTKDGSALIIFVIQFYGTFMIMLPIAYDVLKTYRQRKAQIFWEELTMRLEK